MEGAYLHIAFEVTVSGVKQKRRAFSLAPCHLDDDDDDDDDDDSGGGADVNGNGYDLPHWLDNLVHGGG